MRQMYIVAKSRYDAILNLPKIYNLEFTLYTLNMQENFCFTQVPSFSQNSIFSMLMLTDLIKQICFSSNVFKKIFVLRTSISLIVWLSVQQVTQKYAVTYCNMHEKSLSMSCVLNNIQNKLVNGSQFQLSFVQINHSLYRGFNFTMQLIFGTSWQQKML